MEKWNISFVVILIPINMAKCPMVINAIFASCVNKPLSKPSILLKCGHLSKKTEIMPREGTIPALS